MSLAEIKETIGLFADGLVKSPVTGVWEGRRFNSFMGNRCAIGSR
jgi:hypothetical protein